MAVKKSKMMDVLYGIEIADQVFDRLENIDPLFNREVQIIAYDHYWSLPGLNVKNKSLVTIVSLIALNKSEQTKIHINGFLNSGGSNKEFVNILIYLSFIAGEKTARNGFKYFSEVLTNKKESVSSIRNLENMLNKGLIQIKKTGKKQFKEIDNTDKYIVDVVACIAQDKKTKVKNSIKNFLEESGCGLDDLKNILLHQLVYCGFPTVMNGFIALKEVMAKHNLK